MTKGFSFANTDRMFETMDELAEHLENEHGQVVIREGESEEEAVERCAKKGIVRDRMVCACKDCQRSRNEGRM
jgi:predicted small metal-binding protein